MAKFKNKKTGAIITETLNFYIEKLRNNSNFEEIKIKAIKDTPKDYRKNNKKEEVEDTPQE